MDESLSPSADRAIALARAWAARLANSEVSPVHLLLGIMAQEESRGASLLARFGVTPERLRGAIAAGTPCGSEVAVPDDVVPLSDVVRRLLAQVRCRGKERGSDGPAGTDVLLGELLATAPELRQSLAALGVDLAGLSSELERMTGRVPEPLEAEFDRLDLADPADIVNTYRVLDAAANRAREGLRVLEDHARFARDDRFVAGELKSLRHELRQALKRLPRLELLRARDTEHDVGTSVSTPAEWSRTSPRDVVAANFKRAQEAMRTLEEFGKLECPGLAETLQSLRYRLYTLERLQVEFDGAGRLDPVVLYVLVSSQGCAGELEWTVREALAGGVQAIQLREKALPDRALLDLAHRMRRWTAEAAALFIVNDRPDIARLCDADGVHVGQDELRVLDVRRIVGPRALIGVSTHNLEQARQAARDGADYLGVGPTFPSRTKTFDSFPGLELVREVSAEIRLPAFVIGGVTLQRVAEVVAAGARRVAVSAAICAADDPRRAAAEFRDRLPPGAAIGTGTAANAGADTAGT